MSGATKNPEAITVNDIQHESEDAAEGRSVVIEAINDEARVWEALLDEVGGDRLEAMAAGGRAPRAPWPASLTVDDDINAWIDERSRPRSLDEVIGGSREGYRRLAEVMGRMPDAILDGVPDFGEEDEEEGTLREMIVSRRLFDHLHVDNEPDVRAWLARRDG